LDGKEKEILKRWVTEGEPYQEHWAFTKPVRPPLPDVKDAAWCKTDIDRFVLANLESQGLSPSPEADRPTLIRRVSLDLTGLPPTPEQVDAFVNDKSPDAYEKVVDRLLASPAYGEQMAVPWLDYARYADSHGFQSDPERFMWRWRDWVINAYNADMPYDEFVVEQLAGDLLPNATINQKIATGFNRNNRFNDEGGIIEEEWRTESVIDRASTTSAVFLGLTMECCRCHDHKYDPITQKEFYSFTAYFNSINEKGADTTSKYDKGMNAEPVLKVPTADQTKKLDELAVKIQADETKLAAIGDHTADRLAKLESDGLKQPDGLVAATDASLFPADSPTTKPTEAGPDGKVVYGRDAVDFDRTDSFAYSADAVIRGGGAVLARMTDGSHNYQGYDLFIDGGKLACHIISKWPDVAIKVRAMKALPRNKPFTLAATYDGSGKASGVRLYIDGVAQPLEVLNDTLKGSIKPPVGFTVGTRTGESPLDGDVSNVRVYSRALTPEEMMTIAVGPEIQKILAVDKSKRSPAQSKKLADYAAATDPELAGVRSDLNVLKADQASVESQVGDVMVMQDLPKPRDTFVLIRGDYDKHGEKVEPGTPAVLPAQPKDAPKNRLGLARWIASDDNPLTSRVLVNRLWEKFFGVGIVKTSENLGVQADWPSNPELLDYLATEMIAKHWSQKAFQREIVLSAAYRQNSDVTPELLDRDPENRLIARGPRFRLSAEQIRDQALAVSGLLVDKVGGPSVRPYEPANLWAGNLYGNLKMYTDSTGPDLYRRSIYTFVKRTATPVNLTLFDQPSREYCVIRRSRTDTPLQALDLMNDPTYLECSRVLAEKMMTDGGATPATRLAYGFKRATGREPTAHEAEILSAGFERQLDRLKKDPAAAKELLSVGKAPVNAKLDQSELAAYAVSAGVMLNLDEVVTKE
jgi:hypothetical protein